MEAGSQIHNVAVARVHNVLRSRLAGLDAAEVRERLAALGPNTVEVRERLRRTRLLFRQFLNFFSLLLDVSALLCFVAEHMQPGEGMALLGWALCVVSLLNALFAFLQESRAERAMQELARFLPQRVVVRRGGAEREVLAEELVPGDVLLVAEGTRVPADARLVAARALLVDNAPLTGESRPVSLVAEPQVGRLVESRNVLFAGSAVLRGNGEAVVFSTGRRTEFGKIAALSADIPRPPSPLERETGRMVRTLTIIAVSMGVVFFAYGVVAGRSLWVNLVFMLGIIVANVPEGLLPTFTLALAMGGLRLARRKVLVKSLGAVEALGSVDVICTDKTGTLTQNQLAVTRIVDAIDAGELGERPRRALLATALLACEVRRHGDRLDGDPLDVALAEAYSRHADDLDRVLATKRLSFPFDVQKRRAAALAGRSFAEKGAWEAVRPAVAAVLDADGARRVADDAVLARIDATVRALASRGYRVIAVASGQAAGVSVEQDDLEHELLLLGFVCLEDPLRPEVPAAVEQCRRAGIGVLLVTGDHPDTAEAIARRAGIVSAHRSSGSQVIAGDVLDRLRQRDLVARLRSGTVVFARTTPEQKMKIVSALEHMGHVVGMTGDGVNDAPALKAADVGVAMGRRGTDVAREAAQIILLDDNFASIVAGVEEGRTIFSNIRKFTNYVLVSNGPEIIPYILYILLPVPLALGILQILCIDLGTDIVPSMALGQEPPDREVMNRPPRRRKDGLLTRALMLHSYGFLGLIEAAYSLLLFFAVLVHGGWGWGHELPPSSPVYRAATGITLSTIMLMQIGNFVGRRSELGSGLDRGLLANRLTLVGFGLEIAFSFGVLYVPPLSRIMGAAPAPVGFYLLAWLGAPLIFGADYLRKRWLARRSTHYRPLSPRPVI